MEISICFVINEFMQLVIVKDFKNIPEVMHKMMTTK
jgi:hypothetical protein